MQFVSCGVMGLPHTVEFKVKPLLASAPIPRLLKILRVLYNRKERLLWLAD